MQLLLVVLVSFLMISSSQAREPEVLPGPIPAVVKKVVDGDTLDVVAKIWVGQEVRVRVRVSGIDTPELSGTCLDERRLARKAKSIVNHHAYGRVIHLTEIRRGKYAGRVIAKVGLDDGNDLGAMLLKMGVAQPYKPRHRSSWCCDGERCTGRPLYSQAPRQQRRPWLRW